jgi:hypothetical protein
MARLTIASAIQYALDHGYTLTKANGYYNATITATGEQCKLSFVESNKEKFVSTLKQAMEWIDANPLPREAPQPDKTPTPVPQCPPSQHEPVEDVLDWAYELNVAAPLAVTPPLHIQFAEYKPVDVIQPVEPIYIDAPPTLADAITRYNDLPLFVPKLRLKSDLSEVNQFWQEVARYATGVAIDVKGIDPKPLVSARRELYNAKSLEALFALIAEVEAIVCPKTPKNELKESALEAFNKYCLPFKRGDIKIPITETCDPQTIADILRFFGREYRYKKISREDSSVLLKAEIASGVRDATFIRQKDLTDSFWRWVIVASEVHSRVIAEV